MKENLILLTSTFPFGTGETFLETELPYLAEGFSKVIILPTKKASDSNARSIPKNCIIDTSVISKLTSEKAIKRIFSKLVIALTSSFFYKELIQIFPGRIDRKVIDNLLTYTRDAILSMKAIEECIHSIKIDDGEVLIYSYWCNGSTFGALLTNPKIPVISRVHRGDLYEELSPKNYIPYREVTISNIHSIFSISENGVKYLSKKYEKFASKFRLSRLGIPIPESIQPMSDKSINPLVVVSCSSINDNKRVESIAESLNSFAEKFPKIQITWNHFGTGPNISQLGRLTEVYPENLSAILHGHIENKALMNWYSKNPAHLFINLSKSEGIPVSIMEACSYGIPAIATDVGGTSELISDKTGWLINRSFTVKEIVKVLEEALLNHSVRIQKSINAREVCLANYNSANNYPEFVEALKTLGKSKQKLELNQL